MEINSEIAENFFGVYLLYCANPKYTGRTYIGYTVDPNRRIDKHNAGKDHGGARRTSNRGPWIMVLIVHGFFNNISALRFEWAWQHPHTSRRLKHIRRKRSNEKIFNYHLMILSEMLNVGPWCRLPLTLRWIDTQFGNDYSSFVTPPIHMPITYGAIIARKLN
ncbi:structure-specific endonuclease subunit slx1 isoform X2 [Prorops nasuta]